MTRASNDIDVENFGIDATTHQEWVEAGYAFGRGKSENDAVGRESLRRIEKAGERGDLPALWDHLVDAWPSLEAEVPAEVRSSFGLGLVRAVEDGRF